MDKIKAVIFDFDNTLGDRFRYSYDTYRHLLTTYLSDIDENSILFEAMLQDLVIYDQYGTVSDKNYILEQFERKYKRHIPIDNFGKWWVDNQYKFTVLFPDTAETVKALSKKYKLGVITNGYHDAQWGKLNKSGLLEYFDHCIVSGDVGIHKPDPRIFTMMAEKLELDPSECVYVGDIFSSDVLGASQAGMVPIWIWPSETSKPSDYKVIRISKLSDLLGIL